MRSGTKPVARTRMFHEAFSRSRRVKSPGKPGVHSRPRESVKSKSYRRGKSVGAFTRLNLTRKASPHTQAQEKLPTIGPKNTGRNGPAKIRRCTGQGPAARPCSQHTGPGLFRACRHRQTSLVIMFHEEILRSVGVKRPGQPGVQSRPRESQK